MRRGELWWAAPALAGGSSKKRPFLVVSADMFNAHPRYPKVVVVALTSTVRSRSFDWEVALPRGTAGLPRPGLGIPSLAALDALLLLTMVIIALVGIGIPARIIVRVQGIATVVVSFLGCLGAIMLLFTTIALLLLMVGLLVSVPFGTAIYLAAFGHFERGPAAATLAIVMLLKLAAAFCLVVASLQVLKSKSIVLLFLYAAAKKNKAS